MIDMKIFQWSNVYNDSLAKDLKTLFDCYTIATDVCNVAVKDSIKKYSHFENPNEVYEKHKHTLEGKIADKVIERVHGVLNRDYCEQKIRERVSFLLRLCFKGYETFLAGVDSQVSELINEGR